MEPGGSMPHSQGLSNNSYPEQNQPNTERKLSPPLTTWPLDPDIQILWLANLMVLMMVKVLYCNSTRVFVVQRQRHSLASRGPGFNLGHSESWQPSIVRNLGTNWFVAVILVYNANRGWGSDVLTRATSKLAKHFTSVIEQVQMRPTFGW